MAFTDEVFVEILTDPETAFTKADTKVADFRSTLTPTRSTAAAPVAEATEEVQEQQAPLPGQVRTFCKVVELVWACGHALNRKSCICALADDFNLLHCCLQWQCIIRFT